MATNTTRTAMKRRKKSYSTTTRRKPRSKTRKTSSRPKTKRTTARSCRGRPRKYTSK